MIQPRAPIKLSWLALGILSLSPARAPAQQPPRAAPAQEGAATPAERQGCVKGDCERGWGAFIDGDVRTEGWHIGLKLAGWGVRYEKGRLTHAGNFERGLAGAGKGEAVLAATLRFRKWFDGHGLDLLAGADRGFPSLRGTEGAADGDRRTFALRTSGELPGRVSWDEKRGSASVRVQLFEGRMLETLAFEIAACAALASWRTGLKGLNEPGCTLRASSKAGLDEWTVHRLEEGGRRLLVLDVVVERAPPEASKRGVGRD